MEDTIAAIATPPGHAAIGIVRVSGAEAITAVERCFAAESGALLREQPSHTLAYGRVICDGETLDRALVSVMRAPRSYTGEHVVEISCHGSPVILERVLLALVRQGVRPAERGEFTRRAFLHGKLDLTQAEAVADLITAPTDLVRRAAVRQLEGTLRQTMSGVQQRLFTLLAALEAQIDFPDDVSDNELPGAVIKTLTEVRGDCADLLRHADAGRLLRDGFRVVIAGRPNAGKSSVLNLLVREERALVTEVAGTTRDTIEADINLEGLPVRLIDTAGLRAATGIVERKGIERTRRELGCSDLIAWVADWSRRPPRGEIEAVGKLSGRTAVLWIWNKCDLACRWPARAVGGVPPAWAAVEISALTGAGAAALHGQLAAALRAQLVTGDEQPMLLRARHRELLGRMLEALEHALHTATAAPLPELLATDVRAALDAAGEFTGRITTADVLDRIFSTFCIGK